jgi:DNA-binding transcriptional MerR regulator
MAISNTVRLQRPVLCRGKPRTPKFRGTTQPSPEGRVLTGWIPDPDLIASTTRFPQLLLYLRPSALMPQLDSIEIPNRSLFRQPEVCEIARIQAYVLRSWEAEFPDLGVAKTAGGPRVYRRADVERVLRLKHLLFVEGLTLAGARRKIAEELPVAPDDAELSGLGELLGSDARERILQVERTLRELASMLSRQPGASVPEGEVFQLRSVDTPRPKFVARRPAPKPSSSGRSAAHAKPAAKKRR